MRIIFVFLFCFCYYPTIVCKFCVCCVRLLHRRQTKRRCSTVSLRMQRVVIASNSEIQILTITVRCTFASMHQRRCENTQIYNLVFDHPLASLNSNSMMSYCLFRVRYRNVVFKLFWLKTCRLAAQTHKSLQETEITQNPTDRVEVAPCTEDTNTEPCDHSTALGLRQHWAACERCIHKRTPH